MSSNEIAQKMLLEGLTESIRNTASVVQSLSNEIRDNSVTMATFRVEISHLRTQVDELSRILRTDNGRPSIVTRVNTLENTLEQKLADAAKDRTSESSNRIAKLQFWGTVVAAVISASAAVVAIVFG